MARLRAVKEGARAGGVALVGLLGVAADPPLRAAVGLDRSSRVLVFGCEGATDAGIYEQLVGIAPEDIHD